MSELESLPEPEVPSVEASAGTPGPRDSLEMGERGTPAPGKKAVRMLPPALSPEMEAGRRWWRERRGMPSLSMDLQRLPCLHPQPHGQPPLCPPPLTRLTLLTWIRARPSPRWTRRRRVHPRARARVPEKHSLPCQPPLCHLLMPPPPPLPSPLPLPRAPSHPRSQPARPSAAPRSQPT